MKISRGMGHCEVHKRNMIEDDKIMEMVVPLESNSSFLNLPIYFNEAFFALPDFCKPGRD